MTLYDDKEIKTLLQQLDSDDEAQSVQAQQALIDGAGRMVARKVADFLWMGSSQGKNAKNPLRVVETLIHYPPEWAIDGLSRVVDEKMGNPPEATARASEALMEFIATLKAAGTEESYDLLRSIVKSITIPTVIQKRARKALRDSGQDAPRIVPKVREVSVKSLRELEFDKRWKKCKLSVERMSGSVLYTIAYFYNTRDLIDRVFVGSGEKVGHGTQGDVDDAISILAEQGFKQISTGFQREYEYFEFKR